jgi:isopentenyl diphosphate isomerase/L-lactate dehydrogenase-like FMN-dependent dehydrogenase
MKQQGVFRNPEDVSNVRSFEGLAAAVLDPEALAFINGGADDERTLAANVSAFERWGIRCRRLVDVSELNTRTELFGRNYMSPVFLAPVGFQTAYHPEGERAAARAAAATGSGMIASTVAGVSIGEIAAAFAETAGTASLSAPWFQLYTTPNRDTAFALVERAEAAGCPVLVLTTDVPVVGNREGQVEFVSRKIREGLGGVPNFGGLDTGAGLADPTLTWDVVAGLRERTSMKLVIKGIVTAEDAALCLEHGVDGIIVSNHGGRQEESDRATLECLPEVVEAVGGRIPVLFDGGVRRGTDVFKALALGAGAVCIGRPYVWGLAAFGRAGVERVVGILRRELATIMALAGTPDLGAITRDHVRRTGFAEPAP